MSKITYIPDDHQIVAQAHVEKHPHSCLFLGLSLSKTACVLAVASELKRRQIACFPLLVIAPDKVARFTWPDELEKWKKFDNLTYSVLEGTAKKREAALKREADVYVIGVDNIVWLCEHYLTNLRHRWKWTAPNPFRWIVFDELTLVKNRDSKRFKIVSRFVAHPNVVRRTGLTGTPDPNGVEDLWAQMFCIDQGERLGVHVGEFLDHWFTAKTGGPVVQWVPRKGAVAEIAAAISDICLNMVTRDHVELPPMTTEEWTMQFSDFDAEVYDMLERQYVIETLGDPSDPTPAVVTVKQAADLGMKLRQITSGAIYEDQRFDTDEGEKIERRTIHLNTLKLDNVEHLLDLHPDENFILVYGFRHEVPRIMARFPFARQLKKRVDMEDWNAGKIRLLIIHPASAGHGLNLQFGGRRIIWYTLTENLEYYLQTRGRIERRGSPFDHLYEYLFIVQGTRDEDARDRIRNKDDEQTFFRRTIEQIRAKYGYIREQRGPQSRTQICETERRRNAYTRRPTRR